MSVASQLRDMYACPEALRWIGNRTIERAWRECHRADWMLWLLRRITSNDRRCRLAAADFAERAWRRIPDEPTKLAAAWAIDAARRGDADEMAAAAYTAFAAADASACAAAYASADAAAYADFAEDAAEAAAYASADADAYADFAEDAAEAAAVYAAERRAQADILRTYFPSKEIGRLFKEIT